MRLDVGHPDSEESQHKLDEESNNLHECEHQKLDDQPGPPVQQNGRPLFLLDVFCGTAGVAAAFRSMGGDALGIDHMVDKRRVKGPVAKVNLEKNQGKRLCWLGSMRTKWMLSCWLRRAEHLAELGRSHFQRRQL